MGVLKEVFSSQFGLLSLFTIVFVIVIAVGFMYFFSKHMAEDERKAAKQLREQGGAAKSS